MTINDPKLSCPHCDLVTEMDTFLMEPHLRSEHGYGKQVKTYTEEELLENTDVQKYYPICEF